MSATTVAVDTSALLAIALDEPIADRVTAVALRHSLVMSAATLLECGIVIEGRLGSRGRSVLDELLAAFDITVLPFDAAQAEIAREAHRRYGRGSGSRARLTLADCYSYAVATSLLVPLLFIGDDFSHTDVSSALD